MTGDAGAQHFLGGHGFAVGRMGLAAEGQAVEGVHFPGCQGRGGPGEDDGALPHGFKGPAVEAVHLLLEQAGLAQELRRIVPEAFMGGQAQAGAGGQFGRQMGGQAVGVEAVQPG